MKCDAAYTIKKQNCITALILWSGSSEEIKCGGKISTNALRHQRIFFFKSSLVIDSIEAKKQWRKFE